MKVLLLGEYNRSHHFLKKGLIALGHDAYVLGMDDDFKKVDVDYIIKNHFKGKWPGRLRRVLFRFLKFDLHGVAVLFQLLKYRKVLANNDVVQYINENPLLCSPRTERIIFNYIRKRNKNIFLSSCGDDYISVKFAYDQKLRYSILTPYFEQKANEAWCSYTLKYLTPPYQKLHEHVFKYIKGVIASDMDYHLPLVGHPKYLGMVPNPIIIEQFKYALPPIEDKIVIFHGINNYNYYKKGNDLFEQALAIIAQKHHDKVDIITVRSLPYKEYIKSFNKAHILLDMVYAYDQGFNALEAMAKGKVVFTGAEKEWAEFYNIEEDTIAINAMPDAQNIAQKLSWLIENPDKIIEISKNARAFIENHHDHIESSRKYLQLWQSKMN